MKATGNSKPRAGWYTRHCPQDTQTLDGKGPSSQAPRYSSEQITKNLPMRFLLHRTRHMWKSDPMSKNEQTPNGSSPQRPEVWDLPHGQKEDSVSTETAQPEYAHSTTSSHQVTEQPLKFGLKSEC